MDPILISEEYILVIDTNADSTEFSQHLCAYCTGLMGEVGDEVDEDCFEQKMSDMFYMEMGIDDDESSKGKIALQKNPFYEVIEDRKDEDGNYFPYCVWLSRTYGSNENGQYAKLDESNYGEFDLPAPFSTGIFFGVEPTDELIKIIKERAVKFFKDQWGPLLEKIGAKNEVNVEGFRLISHKKYGEEREL